MKKFFDIKLIFNSAICLTLVSTALAGDKKGYHGNSHNYSHYNSGRGHNSGRYYSSGYRSYYAPGVRYPECHYSHPRTTISLGFGTGYSGYNSNYYREDARPIYRGEQVNENSSSSLSVAVQRKLSRLGYYDGELDGDMGPASRRAILKYQRENDLAETATISRELLESLDLS